ncbi:phosphate ABC transporter permease subunit PstC [Kyrpidia tusciae]|uniref:Phosphate transport system permease protein n=1 Tax=Kyrpidia tusciae (strain DSM 2912 / NBRC 15312 / T2) TaxID=562970 RepID=D5WV28_KYRT2|nr:phosphate ABC transporter permease subunit PstC [Kyrpidia tusciae]ADG07500.1 phosphate ABC transporter, inner membrane subunit PstC [Kyrpidia tusciae DSM 2912]
MGAIHEGSDRWFWRITAGAALGLIVLVVLMALLIWRSAEPSVQTFGASFLIGREWDPVHHRFGALPYIYGSLVSTVLALLIAGPISLGAAIYISEFAPRRLKTPLGFLIDLLAAVPGVIYGLWGSFILAPWLGSYVEPALKQGLGFLPFFGGPTMGIGMLAAGVVLAIMISPVIAAVCREVLEVVPAGQREAMIALGATPWEVVRRAVLPYARTGIVGAFTLGLGKAIGETMAVTMVIGNRPDIAWSLFAPAHTMTSVIINEFTEAVDPLHLAALIHIALVLFLVTLVINILARVLIYQISRRVKQWSL